MMYENLVKTLRESTPNRRLMFTAADAIEELSASVEGLKSTTNMVIEETEGRTVLKFEQKWIPVVERLPKIHTMVLVMDKAHDMAVGSLEKLWDGEVWVCPFADVEDEQCPITHWMPLPEPPKEGEA